MCLFAGSVVVQHGLQAFALCYSCNGSVPQTPPPPPPAPQDFRDYFDAEEEEAARQQQPKSYAHLGALREDSKANYLFDRTSHTRKGSLAAHLR